MSLYNLVHGENTFARALLAALGLTVERVPRYRDCWWDGTYIAVHTRTGGGNRDYYENAETRRANEPESFANEAEAPSGPWNDDLRAIDGFSHDKDDDYDCTYATFYYVPAPALKAVLVAVPATDATPAQRWESFLERLRDGIDDPQVDDPQVQRVREAMKPIVERLEKACQ